MKKAATFQEIPPRELLEKELRRLQRSQKYWKTLRSTVNTLLVVAAIAVLIASLFMPVLEISGDSMEPTLKDEEIVILLKTDRFETGDLCCFAWNNRTLIKRVIAGEASWVGIDEKGNVSVDGNALYEPYIQRKGRGECDVEFPHQVPDNSLFVMGDHRDTSIDSRSSVIGSVDKDQIIGKVFFRIWPLDRFGPL